MDPSDPYSRLSAEAVGIVDQLVDIAHDTDSPDSLGIEWPPTDDELPRAALEELVRVGICRVEESDRSVTAEFTAEGRRRYV